jgi:hypothetical protein
MRASYITCRANQNITELNLTKPRIRDPLGDVCLDGDTVLNVS